MRRLLTVVLLYAFASLAVPADAADKIRLPYSPIGWESLPWYVGKDGGYYEKYGIDADIFFQGASSEIIQAMLAGDAQLAGIGGPALVSNVIAGGDVIQVAALVKTFTIPIYSQPSIKTLTELKGQKVGVSRFGSVTHITALAVLQKAGIAKDVTIVQTGGVPESAAALASGAVAAATVLPPQSLMLKDKGFRELVGLKELRELNIPFVENGVGVRRSFAQKNPELVKRFLKASLEALKRVFDDKAYTMKLLGQYTKVTDPRLLEDSYEWATAAFVKDPRVPVEAMKALADKMIELKMVDAAAAARTQVSAYYDNQYIDALEKEGFLKKLWP
ncbi:MAG TPA: ABC transporter substrate-binding protein [Candidatus Binatia bacterium]|jgi:ABC-type nitrate/sulfonate/bicarbonate transport system substrate-binding protein|nr:ABC transporter substrate-binding protein [Candidatus Binatia bacterium]